jgi:hypothetical protein
MRIVFLPKLLAIPTRVTLSRAGAGFVEGLRLNFGTRFPPRGESRMSPGFTNAAAPDG